VRRFPKRIGRVPTKSSEIRENLEGGSRARQIVKDAVREPIGVLLGVGTEFERTHASSIRDKACPVFYGRNMTKRLEGTSMEVISTWSDGTTHIKSPLVLMKRSEELQQVINVDHFMPNLVQSRFAPASTDESVRDV